MNEKAAASYSPATQLYKQTTNGVEVTVVPTYLEDHSRPYESVYVWSYEVSIANRGTRTLQLMSRHWRICNSYGQTLDVKGAGVVGDQPVLRPGASYAYSSFTNLSTPSGLMFGSYQMMDEDGDPVAVAIPAFSLDSPDQYVLPN